MLKRLAWGGLATVGLLLAIVQFIPPEPVAVPSTLPPAERVSHRVLAFEGIANFRDLGGYPTADGREVRWGRLYRSGTLAHASRWDLEQLRRLDLSLLIDFRSAGEKSEEPNRLPDPPGFAIQEIPTLDDGNKAMVGDIMERLETGNFDGFDPDHFMVTANRQFATEFTPQFREFIHAVVAADGQPLLWHCSAGKDRTGYAAAILLRTLGVPRDVILQDYMASRSLALDARSRDLLLLRVFKGEEAAAKMRTIMGVEPHWLRAAFDAIDQRWGSFERYTREGLQLTDADMATLRSRLLQ